MGDNSNIQAEEEYFSCEFLQGGINFHTFNISSCNFFTKGLSFYCLNGPDGRKQKINFNKINSIRKEVVQGRKVPINCENCFNLKKKIWNFSGRISRIEIDNWQDCNCGCIYCSNLGLKYAKFLTNDVKNSLFYDVYPVLEEIKKQKLFDKNVVIQTVGGEPANLKEYPKIIKFFLDLEDENLCETEIGMLTSGIQYVPEIAKALERPDKYLTISLDCGTRETYKRIKQIDSFDNCISNIKKYVSHSKYEFQVILKYIFLPNINDNEEEIDKFFEIVQKVGCKQVNFSLEFCQALRHKQGQDIPKNLYNLFDYAEMKAKNLEINFQVYDMVKDLLKKGHY